MNNTLAILVSSIVSFIFGLGFMFVIMLFSENKINMKDLFKKAKSEVYNSSETESDYYETNNNSLVLLHEILLENKKKLALLFVSCLIVGLYCGNTLMQGITMNH